MSANEDIKDSVIRHSVYLAKYGEGLADKVLALLNSADKDMSAKLASGLATELGERRLRQMLAELRALSDDVYGKAFDLLESELNEQAAMTAEYHAQALSDALPFHRASLPLPVKLATIATTSPIDGHLLKSWTDNMSANRIGRVEQALRVGMIQGETIDQLVRRVMGSKAKGYKDGVMDISRRSARSMVITANATIAARAREETFNANAKVIKSVQWVSTLDTRTSPICQSRDGMVWALGSDHPKPPAHIRCRSILTPVTKSAKELGLKPRDVPATTRASMDGQVPGNVKYGDWLAKQSPERQNEILGKARADLFRTGNLPFKELYRTDGSYRSLSELRQALNMSARPPSNVSNAATATTAAPTGFSPINPDLTDATVKIAPRLTLQKQMTAHLAKSAADPRHYARPEYKNSRPDQFGKASFSKEFNDQTVSVIAAVAPECDAICDAFGVPRIRGYKTITAKGAGANMGDAVMGMNPKALNRLTAGLGKADLSEDIEAAAKSRLTLETKLTTLKDEFATIDARRKDALKAANTAKGEDATKALDLYDKLTDQRAAKLKEWTSIRDEYVSTAAKVNTLSAAQRGKTASTWKAGDDAKQRPFGADAYFTSSVDKVRQLMYHETAHNVHQLFGKTAPRQRYELFPMEKEISDLFGRKRFDKGWLDSQPSTYATTKPVEWFAESFSLYMMGRKELVDGDLIKLIERFLSAARK